MCKGDDDELYDVELWMEMASGRVRCKAEGRTGTGSSRAELTRLESLKADVAVG